MACAFESECVIPIRDLVTRGAFEQERPSLTTSCGGADDAQLLDQPHGDSIKRNESFVVELAERHLEELVADCGHIPTWDAPELVAEVIVLNAMKRQRSQLPDSESRASHEEES